MLIIGCDYHPSFQQIACVDTDTGELSERRLGHREQAEQFYRELKQRELTARVGMESSGYSRWFERLLQELGFELWIGDPAEIRTKRVRKQKTDRQDAQLLLRLMLEDRFLRIWVPDDANRDLRQLLWHRHRLVQMRTRVMNQLHVVPLNEGLRRKKALWRHAPGLPPNQLALARCDASPDTAAQARSGPAAPGSAHPADRLSCGSLRSAAPCAHSPRSLRAPTRAASD
jgi:transposase